MFSLLNNNIKLRLFFFWIIALFYFVAWRNELTLLKILLLFLMIGLSFRCWWDFGLRCHDHWILRLRWITVVLLKVNFRVQTLCILKLLITINIWLLKRSHIEFNIGAQVGLIITLAIFWLVSIKFDTFIESTYWICSIFVNKLTLSKIEVWTLSSRRNLT